MPDGTRREDMFSAMVSMTLPIWRKEKIEPGIRAMAAEREMAVRDAETLDAEAPTRSALARVPLELRGGGDAVPDDADPQAEQAVQSNLEAYQVGKIDFPMLMDSLMAMLNFRKEYLGMVGEAAYDESAAGGGGGQGTRWRGTMSDERSPWYSRFSPPSWRCSRRCGRVLQCPGLPCFAPSARRGRQRGEARRQVHMRHAPFIISDKPGNCPICGMALTKIEGSAAPPRHLREASGRSSSTATR